jgi:hypothetical protein
MSEEEKWLDKSEHISEAMEMVPIMEQFIKHIKNLVKERLKEDPQSIPGFKLRESGEITSYEAVEVAKILMETGILEWNDLMKAMRFSETPMVKVWAEKFPGMNASEIRKDLKQRLSGIAKTRSKAPAIIKDHDAKG